MELLWYNLLGLPMFDVFSVHETSRVDDPSIGALTNAPLWLDLANAHAVRALRGVLAVQVLIGSLDDGLLVC